MLRVGGALALLASLGLAGLLALRIQRHSFSGPIYAIDGKTCSFWVDQARDNDAFTLILYPPRLPSTFPADLASFRMEGTKYDPDTVCGLQLPEELRGRAAVDAQAKVQHDYLGLPLVGPVVGRTTVKVGPAEWRDGPWRLWAALAGFALLPPLFWGLALIPFQLLRKRPSGSSRGSP